MKPYGRVKKIKFPGKIDSHIHSKNHHKIGNWWEDHNTSVEKGAIKHNVKKEIKDAQV